MIGVSRAQWRALLVVLPFVGALVASVYIPLRDRTGPPSNAFVQAAEGIDGRILVHPPWRDDAVTALEAAGHNATLAVAKKHGEPMPSLTVIADPAWPLPSSWTVSQHTERFGLNVGELGRGPVPGRMLDDDIVNATVTIERDTGGDVTCAWSPAEDRHRCPGMRGWVWVGPTDISSGGESSRCLWSHPVNNARVVTAFAPQRLPSKIAFRHALADRIATSGASVRARLVIEQGGTEREVAELVRSPRRGFAETVVDIGASDALRTLKVIVDTEKDGARHYCFSVRALP